MVEEIHNLEMRQVHKHPALDKSQLSMHHQTQHLKGIGRPGVDGNHRTIPVGGLAQAPGAVVGQRLVVDLLKRLHAMDECTRVSCAR